MRRSRRTLKQRSNVALLNNSPPCALYFEMLLTYMRGAYCTFSVPYWRMARKQGGWKQHNRGGNMKKLMLLAALLAMLIVAAVPAIAQITQEEEQEGESGEVDQDFSATSEGDNSSQCANIQGVANTGNAQNQIDVIQYGSEADDFAFDEVGSTITVNPNEDVDEVFTCDTQVNQAASASG